MNLGIAGKVALVLAATTVASSQAAANEGKLVSAAKSGNVKELFSALANTGDANQLDGEGISALLWAISRSRTGLARLLLANGADAFLRVPEGAGDSVEMAPGDTVLHVAARNADTQTLRLLLAQDRMPDIDTRNSLGETPLVIAAKRGRLEVFRELVSGGANLNLKGGPEGAAPLWFVAARGHHEILTEIGDSGRHLEVDATAQDGTTPLMAAVREDYTQVAEVLIAMGADVNIRDLDGKLARDHAKSQRMRDLLTQKGVMNLWIRASVALTVMLVVFSVLVAPISAFFKRQEWLRRYAAPAISALIAIATVQYAWQYSSHLVDYYLSIQNVAVRAFSGFMLILGGPLLSALIFFRASSAAISPSRRSPRTG